VYFQWINKELFLSDSANGAAICARTAIQASVCVDYVSFVALRDSANGAGICAGTAANASRRNLVCHESTSIKVDKPILARKIRKATIDL